MNLSPLPLQKFFDNAGKPLVGGLLFTYVAGTSTKIATYTDSTGSQQNTNPIELDYRGEANVWLDPMLSYKFTLAPKGDTDPPTRSIWTVDHISAAITLAELTRQILGQILFPQTLQESSAGVDPTYFYFQTGEIDRYGADSTGATDSTGSVIAADASYPFVYVQTPGTYKIGALTLDSGYFRGLGYTSNPDVHAGAYFTKGANGTHLIMGGDDAEISDLDLDGTGFSGDGVQMGATRQNIIDVSSSDQAGVGFHFGGVGPTGTFNANLWRAERPLALRNGGDGIYINHTGGTVSAQFPSGIPDVNAGLMLGCDSRINAGIGIHIANTIDNAYIKAVAQNNTGKGVVVESTGLGHHFFSVYSEANNGGVGNFGDEVDLLPGCYNNMIWGARTPPLGSGSGVRDQCAPGKNLVCTYETGISGGSWAVRGKWQVWNELADGTGADLEFFKGVNYVNVASIRNTLTGSSGGLCSIYTKIDGGASTPRLDVNAVGLARLQNTTGGLLIGKPTADTTTAGWQIGDAGSGTNSRANSVGSGSASDTRIAFYNSNGLVGSIVTSASATAYNTSSDARLKSRIGDVPLILDDIQVHHFRWNADGSEDAGVFAQELHEVVPHAVTVGGDDPVLEPWSVDYSKLVPLLIAEIQAMKKRVKDLES